jgi:hypothetical protein
MRKLCLRCDACIGYRLPAYVESQLVEFTSESSSGCFSSRRATQVTGFDVKSLDQGSLVHTNLSLSLSLSPTRQPSCASVSTGIKSKRTTVMPPQSETLLASVPASGLPQLAPTALNLMPFHLDYTGPAEVSTYFQPRTVPGPPTSEEVSEEQVLKQGDGSITVAAFRGRRVQAYTLGLPEGYTGLVLTAPSLASRTNPSFPQTQRHAQSNTVKNLKREESPSLSSDAAPGLRRSPRKRNNVDVLELPVTRRVKPKRVMQKFSMDSDSEDEEAADEDEGVVLQETVEKKEEKVVVKEDTSMVIESSTTTTTTTITNISNLDVQSLQPDADPELDQDHHLDLDLLQPAPPIFSRTLLPTASFSSLTIWNPDGPLDEGKDEYCRTLGEWMSLNSVLHQE